MHYHYHLFALLLVSFLALLSVSQSSGVTHLMCSRLFNYLLSTASDMI